MIPYPAIDEKYRRESIYEKPEWKNKNFDKSYQRGNNSPPPVGKEYRRESIYEKPEWKNKNFDKSYQRGNNRPPLVGKEYRREKIYGMFTGIKKPLDSSEEFKKYKRKVDQMSGRRFEKEIASLYESFGYEVRIVGGRNDYAVDIVAKNNSEKLIIQCKRRARKGKVRSPEIQQLSGARLLSEYKDSTSAILVTNRYVTKDGKEYASKAEIQIIERKKLFERLKQFKGFK